MARERLMFPQSAKRGVHGDAGLTPETAPIRGRSLEDFRDFPATAKREAGYQIGKV